MLQLDIAGIMNEREIPNHNAYLCNNGFSPFIASRLLNNKTKSISFAHLQKLCLLFRCTPNDLYVWNAPNTMKNNTSQPIYALVPIIKKPFIASRLQHLPVEKLREIKKAIDEAMKMNA